MKNYTNLFRIKLNDKWGYIDNNGQVIIEPIFQYAWTFG
ncbi:WG repeat-containing protein [Clostridium ljungdahlii]